MNEYSSDLPLPHAWQFGAWLLSESSPDNVMRLRLPNSTFLFGTVSDISHAPKARTLHEGRFSLRNQLDENWLAIPAERLEAFSAKRLERLTVLTAISATKALPRAVTN
jgi:hypothetical protein